MTAIIKDENEIQQQTNIECSVLCRIIYRGKRISITSYEKYTNLNSFYQHIVVSYKYRYKTWCDTSRNETKRIIIIIIK